MNINPYLFSIVSVAALTNAYDIYSKKISKQPLNIIYIMTDDHTQQMISCYDNRFATTPNIDRLASEGVRFTNSFVANSISGPSRACMLTGKHSHANGKINNAVVFDGSQQTMPKLLQKAGYQTALFGKWHLESKPTGFDQWEILHGQGEYFQPDFITNTDTVRTPGYVTDLITDKSIAWLEHRKKNEPFALFIHHKAPHRNWMPKIADLEYAEDREFPLPDNFFDDYSGREAAKTAEMKIGSDHDMDLLYDNKVYTGTETSRLVGGYCVNNTNGAYGRMTPAEKSAFDKHYNKIIADFKSRNLQGKDLAIWKYQRYMKDYSKAAKAVDDNIGRLMKYLEQNNLLENTIIVYTSDQGFYMGEHGWFDKRFMYEESFRTPLVMRLPSKLKRRGDITELVQNIDYAPTFLDIAGAKIPNDIQGMSVLPLLKDRTNIHWRDCIYYHFHEYPAEHAVKRHYGVRNNRYKLIHFYNDIDSWELYDLQEDPTEMHNQYNNPAYSNIVKSMKVSLIKLQEQYNDPVRFTYPVIL